MDLYLREIDRTPLLTAAGEHDLAVLVEAGDIAARDELVRSNLRLVVRISREYTGRGLALEDLISEGNIGLMRAAEGFSSAAGTRFSTYASFWIKQSIRLALNKSGHAVRIPQYVGTLLTKWRRMESTLRDELGREATREEVADALGLKKRQMQAVLKAQRAMAAAQAGSEEGDWSEMLPDGRCPDPADCLANAETLSHVAKSLDGLGERAANILRLRFGLAGEDPATLQDVGQRLGLTRERIRQLERESLLALRECVA
jgi:RNA polymerase primary sigma factor